MNNDNEKIIEQEQGEIISRTSSNNMICLVEYIPLSEDEQEKLEEIFAVAS